VKQFPTERERVYNFANTHDRKWDIFGTKNCTIFTQDMVLLETFFLLGNQFFLFYNFNTATHAYGGLKNQNFDLFF
jgi:hypothetical protein